MYACMRLCVRARMRAHVRVRVRACACACVCVRVRACVRAKWLCAFGNACDVRAGIAAWADAYAAGGACAEVSRFSLWDFRGAYFRILWGGGCATVWGVGLAVQR